MPALRFAVALLTWLLVAVVLRPGRPAGAMNAPTQAVVDEVIAGIDANLALVAHGTAVYSVRKTMDKAAGKPGPAQPRTTEGEVRVWFDYPRIQFEWTGTGRVQGDAVTTERAVLDGKYHYRFPVPPWTFGVGGPPGDACVVFINPAAHATLGCNYIHPREQLHQFWIHPPSLADRLREMAHLGAKAPLAAFRQADGLIRIEYTPERGGDRGTYWISPTQGYSLVRAEEWSAWSPGQKPNMLYEAAARAAGNGAFVLEQRLEKGYAVAASGELQLFREEESTLREIDLEVAPDPVLFTIDGMGLRRGARIRDKVHGREYRYGVEGAEERAIVVPGRGHAMTLRYWLIGLSLAAGALAAGWLVYRSRGVPQARLGG